MKIIAKRGIEVNGYGVIRKGMIIDISEDAITPRIASAFVTLGGEPLTVSDDAKSHCEEKNSPVETTEIVIERTVDVLGREGILRKLDEMGITYRPQHKTEYLAKLYLSAKGDI